MRRGCFGTGAEVRAARRCRHCGGPWPIVQCCMDADTRACEVLHPRFEGPSYCSAHGYFGSIERPREFCPRDPTRDAVVGCDGDRCDRCCPRICAIRGVDPEPTFAFAIVEPQETRWQSYGGMAWGKELRLLARQVDGPHELVWFGGHGQVHTRGYGPVYHGSPSRLMIADTRHLGNRRTLVGIGEQGGRLSTARILADPKIDETFGYGTAREVAKHYRRATIVVSPEKPGGSRTAPAVSFCSA